jgi:hypothetical protein
MVRYVPGRRWPLLLAAVRDEFVDRAWDPPGRHWAGAAAGLIGGRDRFAGGTWLAVDPGRPAVAAVLNGVRLPEPAGGVRPSRGGLPLAALTGGDGALPELAAYDGVHVLRGGLDRLDLWTWDGVAVRHRELAPGHHIVVNDGVDVPDQPLVAHFLPLLVAAAEPDPRPGLSPERAWGDWLRLLAGDGLDPTDPRAVIIRREYAGRPYGSTSATLVALGPDAVRYDFAAPPGPVGRWQEVRAASPVRRFAPAADQSITQDSRACDPRPGA